MTLPLNSHRLPDVNSSSSSSSSHHHPTQLLDSDFLLVVAALLCALICVLGLVAVARCAWIRRIAQTSTTTTSGTAPPATNKALNKQVLNSLPKLTYSPAHHHRHHHADEEEIPGIPLSGKLSVDDCAICLAELVSGDEIRLLPQCRHMFHVGCIDKWFKSHSSCPSCRVQVATPTSTTAKPKQQLCHKCRELPSATSSSSAAAAATTTPSSRNSPCLA